MRAKYFIIICLLFVGTLRTQVSKQDSALLLLPYLPGDTIKINRLLTLNRAMIAEGNISGALEVTNKAIGEVEKGKSNPQFLRFMLRMVDACINHGNYPAAMDYAFKIKNMATDINALAVKADAVNAIGIIYWYEGQYKKALPFFEDALKINQQVNGDRAAAGILNNMGLVYRQMNDFDKAIEYYKKAIYLCKRTGREEGEANAYNNLGIIYQLRKEYFNALLYLNLSLDIRKKINDEIGIATSLGNLGTVYLETKKYKEAEEFYRESFAISKRLDDFEGIKEIGKNLSDLFEIKRMPDSTLKYYKIFVAARDTLINEATQRDALKREMQYKYEKETERKNILNEAEKRKQRIFTYSAVVILVLISVFALVLLQRIRVTRRQKRIIEEKNQEILSSIHYAKRIQQSLLTSNAYIEKNIKRLKRI